METSTGLELVNVGFLKQKCNGRDLEDFLNLTRLVRSKIFLSKWTGRVIMHQMGQWPLTVIQLLQAIVSLQHRELGVAPVISRVFLQVLFAFDKIYYAQLIPLYLAEMRALPQLGPGVYQEFLAGNWVVNKSSLPFSAIGADHALEQLNRWMKVSGGITGITLNDRARNRFFLVAPLLAALTQKAYGMAGMSPTDRKHHHTLSNAVTQREDKSIDLLEKTICEYTNPFTYNGNDVVNFVTKAVMSKDITNDLLSIEMKGEEQHKQFVEDRIKTNNKTVFDRFTKIKLKHGNITPRD